jgi:hypothetical protein
MNIDIDLSVIYEVQISTVMALFTASNYRD